MKTQWIHIITILLILSFVIFPHHLIAFSNGVLGKLFAILLILYFSTIDRLYGLLICLLIVLYYQDAMMDREGFDEYKPNTVNTGAVAKMSAEYMTPVETSNPTKETSEFRQKYCHLGKLTYKGYDISKENAQHVFPTLQFSKDGICDPCEPACKYSISEVIDSERKILPKSSKDWMAEIQEEWQKGKIAMSNMVNELSQDLYNPLYQFYTKYVQGA